MRKLFQFQIFVKVSLAVILLFLGCQSAQTSELPRDQEPKRAVQGKTEPVKHEFIPKSLREAWVAAKLEAKMRIPVNAERGVFFTTEKERKENMSFSLEDTRDGYMVNGKPVPVPSTLMRQLPVQYERGIAYGTTEFISLIESTAQVMQKKYPGTVMYLGNFCLPEGGDIPYSVSHNSGRDGDIAYYLTDEQGRFAHPQNLHKINRRFVSREAGPKYTFDIEKNATLIETLLMQDKVPLQFIFVAKHLRSALRKELSTRANSEAILLRFDETVQELASHDDHFHIRIYCSNEDICAGCLDKSIVHEWVEDPEPKRAKCVEKHIKTLSGKNASAESLAASLQRIALLSAADQASNKIVKYLSHEDAHVRAAAAFAATSLGSSASRALSERLGVETDHSVTLALLDALAKHDTETTAQAMIDALQRLAGNSTQEARETVLRITRHIVHNPRQMYAAPIIEVLPQFADQTQFDAVVLALEVVSNRAFRADTTENTVLQARTWYEANADKARSQWLIAGFKKAGFATTNLQNADIPLLLDAIDAHDRAVSINAQLTLKTLGHLEQDSLDWSVSDARWHYTRYFKRRTKKYKINLDDRDEHGIKIQK